MEGRVDQPQGFGVHRGVIAFLSVLGSLAISSPAFAGGLGDGWTDGSGVGANAGESNGTQPDLRSGGRSGSAPVCTYTVESPENQASDDQFSQSGWGPTKGAEPGAWYRQICVDAAGNSTGLIVWLVQQVDPATLARQALDYSKLPVPQFALNPTADKLQLVNLPIWLAVPGTSWSPVSASASAGGVAVTTTATPTRVVWSTGDGGNATCDGPGTVYDASRPASTQRSSCTYAYTKSSVGQPNDAYTLTATVEWRIAWTATGVAAGTPAAGDLGVIGRSASTPLRVGEVQAVNQGK